MSGHHAWNAKTDEPSEGDSFVLMFRVDVPLAAGQPPQQLPQHGPGASQPQVHAGQPQHHASPFVRVGMRSSLRVSAVPTYGP